jgi:hypothetical protein
MGFVTLIVSVQRLYIRPVPLAVALTKPLLVYGVDMGDAMFACCFCEQVSDKSSFRKLQAINVSKERMLDGCDGADMRIDINKCSHLKIDISSELRKLKTAVWPYCSLYSTDIDEIVTFRSRPKLTDLACNSGLLFYFLPSTASVRASP